MDIYSLGVVLLEMCYILPFQINIRDPIRAAETCMKTIRRDRVIPIKNNESYFGIDYRDMILSMITKRPDDRKPIIELKNFFAEKFALLPVP